MDQTRSPTAAGKRYEESFGLSTPPDSPTKQHSHRFRLIHASSSTSLHSNFSRSSKSSAKQPRVSTRSRFLRSNRPTLDWRALELSPPYHSLPSTPYESTSPVSVRNSLTLHLPITPPLSAREIFDPSYFNAVSERTLDPSASFHSEQYITACSSPNQFGEQSPAPHATEDERRVPMVDPRATVSSIEDFRLSIFRAYSSNADESMDSVDFDQFPEPPKTTPAVTTNLQEVWDEDEMPTVSGWLDDSSDEEEDEEDLDEVVDKALRRKWHVMEHDADNVSSDFENVDDGFKCATMVTTTKPRLITISNSSSTFSMASHVGMSLPPRPSTPPQYREISAFSPDTPHRRSRDNSISGFSTQDSSWGPVREFWSRASSIDAANLPPLPPMYDMDNETPVKSCRRASAQSGKSTSSSKSIISAASLAKSRQVLPPPVLSPRPGEWRPSVSTINQENTAADLYHAVRAFPFDSLSLSLSVITSLHAVNENALLTPLKRIFPNASVFLLDSLAACVVAQCWVRQYRNNLEQHSTSKQNPTLVNTASETHNNPTTISHKATTMLGLTMQTSKSTTSFSTALSSPPLTPTSPVSTQINISESSCAENLLVTLDNTVDRLLESVTGISNNANDASSVVATLKTSVQVVVEAVLDREA